MEIEFTAKCKAFAGEGVRENEILVEEDGTVRVWDVFAREYTLCHSLSQGQQARLRKLAEARMLARQQ